MPARPGNEPVTTLPSGATSAARSSAGKTSHDASPRPHGATVASARGRAGMPTTRSTSVGVCDRTISKQRRVRPRIASTAGALSSVRARSPKTHDGSAAGSALTPATRPRSVVSPPSAASDAASNSSAGRRWPTASGRRAASAESPAGVHGCQSATGWAASTRQPGRATPSDRWEDARALASSSPSSASATGAISRRSSAITSTRTRRTTTRRTSSSSAHRVTSVITTRCSLATRHRDRRTRMTAATEAAHQAAFFMSLTTHETLA